MNYENYMELYEALYFFEKVNGTASSKVVQPYDTTELEELGLHASTYTAVLRILAVNQLLDFDGSLFLLTSKQQEKHRELLETIIHKAPHKQYAALYSKAINPRQFFFDDLSDLEYDIYSRCNFELTYRTGNEVAKYVNMTEKKVLEVGGNSGGLGSALLQNSTDCHYTIVDTRIPCTVGNEFRALNKLDITFIEGNIFDLSLEDEIYDHVILMNILHDFDDEKCLQILNNCARYSEPRTTYIVIEDILTANFEPKAAIMHGLRLAVECRGGRQRTVDELVRLFDVIGCTLDQSVAISGVHRMLVFRAV